MIRKTMIAFLAIISFFMVFAHFASADGVSVTLSLDKEDYKADDLVTLTAKLSSPIVTNLTFEIDDPDDNLILILTNQTNSSGETSISFRIGDDADIGDYNVYVTGNTSQGIIENQTSFSVKSTSPLTISPSDITASKQNTMNNEEITLYAMVHNNGDTSIPATVNFYEENPDFDGYFLESDDIIIPPQSSKAAKISYTAIDGNHTIFVTVQTDEYAAISASRNFTFGQGVQSILVLYTGDINIYRFEPEQERTIAVQVTCYLQNVNDVHLVVLDDQNLTINASITPQTPMKPGDTIPFYLRIKAPELTKGVKKLEKDIVIQAVGDNGIFSNAEELDIVVSKSAVSFLNPVTIAGAVATGTLATLGAAAAASRRSENWKYLLLSLFAVPLYTRIHGNETLDNFVRGQVYGHIQSKPGTHFNEIRKTLRLGNGNLAYHLRKLEKEGFIKSRRDKRYRRFYPVGVEVPEENGIKLSKTQESILDFIERHPKSSQKEISKELKESQQTISYNINVLVREGFLREEKINGAKRYEILDENT